MKIFFAATLSCLLAVITCKAQWATTGTNIYNSNTGNVGIGTISPSYKLDVAGDINTTGIIKGFGFPLASVNSTGSIAAYYSGTLMFEVVNNLGAANLFTILNDGNTGIGTQTPLDKLDVKGNISLSGGGEEIHFRDISNSTKQYIWLDGSNNLGMGAGSTANSIFVSTVGNVGVGTSHPDQKLTVNGTIHSKGVLVDVNIPLPDYVFAPTYKLPHLAVLKAYIAMHHHLPGIPSAEQATKDGLNLGEMNEELLKKTEELTLYLMEKDTQVKELEHKEQEKDTRLQSQQKQLNTQKKQLGMQQDQINELKALVAQFAK